MPVIKSAIKKARKDKKLTKQNRSKRKDLHDVIVAVEKAVANKETDKLAELLKSAQKIIDKSVKKNIIHKNRGNRKKSRLARIVKQQSKKTD